MWGVKLLLAAVTLGAVGARTTAPISSTPQFIPANTPPLTPVSFRCDAKNFIVTGGSRGLGKCVARALAAQGASAVLLTARSAEAPAVLAEFAKDYPDCRVAYVSADGAEPEAGTAKIIEAARELFGVGGEGEGGVVVHGLVNVAGVAWPRSNLEQITATEWNRMMTINVLAPTLLSQAVSNEMKVAGIHGSIVHVGSIVAYGGSPIMNTYTVSKAALNAFTKVSAVELAEHRIRMNCVNMAWTLTDEENKQQTAEKGEDWLAQVEPTQLLGRLLREQDVAATIGHLLESSMLTGGIYDISPDFINGCLPHNVG